MPRRNKAATSSQYLSPCALVENSNLVSINGRTAGKITDNSAKKMFKKPEIAMGQRSKAPNPPSLKTSLSEFIGKLLQNSGFPIELANSCANHWRANTKKQHTQLLRNWISYNLQRAQDSYSLHINKILEFLQFLHKDKKYTFHYLRQHVYFMSILRKSSSNPFSQTEWHWLKMFLGSVFNKLKPRLGDKVTWDVNVLFNYFKKLGLNRKLSLQQLAEKTATLLSNMCRKCELLYLSLDRIVQNTDNKIVFKLDSYTKTVTQDTPQK